MRQGFKEVLNVVDDSGMPAGGCVHGTGIIIDWQDGPLGTGDDRQEPNGAFVEDVIEAASQRIEWCQTACDGRFQCKENEKAIGHLASALAYLESRTARRTAAGVEGTHAEDAEA